MRIDFTGQVVLVTGGTRGIGKEVADRFESLGAQVVVTGRDTSATAKAQNFAPGRAFMSVDFSDRTSTESFVAGLEKLERIDVLVNNAGINRIDPIVETKDGDWDAIRAVNLDGPLMVTRAVSRVMKRHRYGRIVNIASIFGVISKPKRVLYSMSKFGIRGLTVGSALDLAPYNILVNTVSPGFVMTDLTRSILSPAEMDELAAQVPLGRFAETAEITNVIMFLASNLNTYMTAQNVVVDGGFVNV